MTFYREISQAMAKIERHIDNLAGLEEDLDREYDSLLQPLLDGAEDFDEEAFRSFKKLRRLRNLKKLNLLTILALQYLRVCLWCLTDGDDWNISPGRSIEMLRNINTALDDPSQRQVRQLSKSIDENLKEAVSALSRGPDTIRLALACIDEEVAQIFGEAICAPRIR